MILPVPKNLVNFVHLLAGMYTPPAFQRRQQIHAELGSSREYTAPGSAVPPRRHLCYRCVWPPARRAVLTDLATRRNQQELIASVRQPNRFRPLAPDPVSELSPSHVMKAAAAGCTAAAGLRWTWVELAAASAVNFRRLQCWPRQQQLSM